MEYTVGVGPTVPMNTDAAARAECPLSEFTERGDSWSGKSLIGN